MNSGILKPTLPAPINALAIPAFVNPPQPNFALGYELSTGTHAFQIFVSNTDGIVPQEIYMYNQAEWEYISNWRFGFVMTRLWGF